MPYDAAFAAGVAYELNNRAAGGRIEKIQQPEPSEIVLLIRRERENMRLVLNAGTASPKVFLSCVQKENPQTAPMLCMLFRKHLTNAKLTSVRQEGFDRVLALEFDATDEMGFAVKRTVQCEIMGQRSNVMLLDGSRRIIAAMKTTDFSSSVKRQILPGLTYELPPSSGKLNPLFVDRESFLSLLSAARASSDATNELTVERFLMSCFDGTSALLSREIAYRASRSTTATLAQCEDERLWSSFSLIMTDIREGRFTPCIVEGMDGRAVDFSFLRPRQYENGAVIREYASFGEVVDSFYGKRDEDERRKQKAQDILKLLTNTASRLTKKIALQTADLSACADKDKLRKYGELITSNIYALKKGDKAAKVVDYYSEDGGEITIPLDTTLTPSQNAQRYFKKYNKLKSAEVHLREQLDNARRELDYIDTVFDSLTRANTEKELSEIREELYSAGYAKRMKKHAPVKQTSSKPLEFTSPSGHKIYCGKNNRQNDYITTSLASKTDWWFHVKDMPGSHCVLVSPAPTDEDMTYAARIAAVHSKAAGGQNVAVDYTQIRYVKKPSGAKPGYVIYDKYNTAYVDARE
ncbi:MAG: NFACT family protein [Eubacteriales bacterium]